MTGTDIHTAAYLLKHGKLVAVPTETVYGLAGNALNEQAAASIFKVKNRPAFDPLILHVHNLEQMKRYGRASGKLLESLVSEFCPGPVTFVLPKKDVVPDIVTSGLDTVALRIPDHPLTLELLQLLDFPLAAPSANPFGYTSPTTAKHVGDLLGDDIHYILDGGPCRVGIESTIIQITEDDEIEILRLGGLSVEEIERAAGQPVKTVSGSSSKPAAPGMLESHYNPGIPVYLDKLSELTKDFSGKKAAVISFRTPPDGDFHHTEILSKEGDLTEAARNLFAALRRSAASGAEVVLAQTVPDTGLGRAVNDRLKRAAVR